MRDLTGDQVKIVEVGPRDGLQNEKSQIETVDKVEFIHKLAKSGLKTIEATSFVSPKAIPQMADSCEVFKKVSKLLPDVNLPCLVPNIKGMQQALDCAVKEIALFSATSDAFTQKNINASIEESFERMHAVAQMAKDNQIKIRGYISTVFGCPYAGDIPIRSIIDVMSRMFKLGAYEISLGDTIGIATPKQVDDILKVVLSEFDSDKVALHFHDTRGLALANTLVGLDRGIRIFDASAAGLGGCPYAKGASGNVATEELIRLFHSYGMKTGIDMQKLLQASSFILNKLNKESSSKLVKVLIQEQV